MPKTKKAQSPSSTKIYYGEEKCPNRCDELGGYAPLYDYSHVPGVGCGACGAYWIPFDRKEK